MTERFHDIALTVNGEDVRERVDARKTLVDFLRDDLGLTGSHVGCEHGVCGACTVRFDGMIVRGCLDAWRCSATADGSRPSRACPIRARSPICRKRSRPAMRCNAASARPACCSRRKRCSGAAACRAATEIREHLSGNYCRCTGYHAIVDAIEAVAQARAERRT